MGEPIYREVCEWINRRRGGAGPPDLPWPLDDPDAGEDIDPERTVPRFWIPEHLLDAWEEGHEPGRDSRGPGHPSDFGECSGWPGWG